MQWPCKNYGSIIDNVIVELQTNKLRATNVDTLHFFTFETPRTVRQLSDLLSTLRNNRTTFSPYELCSFKLQSLPDLFARFLRLVDGALVKRSIEAC